MDTTTVADTVDIHAVTVANLQLPLLKSSHLEYSCDNISLIATHFIAHSLSCCLESEFFYLTTFKYLGLGLFTFVTSKVSLFVKNYLSL